MGLIKKRNELNVNVRLKMLIYGQAGMGKAQPTYCSVLTPNGYKTLGEIKVGDRVMGKDGNVQEVLGVFPQGVRPVYKVTTNDGAVTFCDEEHIWSVRTSTGNGRKAGFRNMTMKQMLAKGVLCNRTPREIATNRKAMARYEIPVCSPMMYEAKEFEVNPYILGVLIGDGSLNGSVALFSNPYFDSEIRDKVESLLPSSYTLSEHDSPACPQYSIVNNENAEGYIQRIKRLGLDVTSKHKFIPDAYKYGSFEQRLDLLRGLMDTDGCAINNRVYFSTSSEHLAEDVIELVNSLGGIAVVHIYSQEGKSDEYRVSIRMKECPFYLTRKANEWDAPSNRISRYIIDATRVEDAECVCIKVSNDDELFVTDNFIVTHNTTLALSSTKPLLLDCDGGINRVDYAFIKDTVQVEKYEDVLDVLNKEDLSDYDTIVVDTGGKMLDLMADYIIRLYPKMARRNGSLTMEGYGQRKREFSNLLRLIDSKKKNIIFVAHRQTEKNGDTIKYVPLFGGSNYDSLATELDLIGYLVADDRRRTITFDPTSESEGKNTCNMPSVMEVPNLKDGGGNVVGDNNFLAEKVFKAYRDRLIERSAEGETYKKLIEQIEEDINTIDCVDGANNFVNNVTTGYDHIGNSLAVARQKFVEHVNKLGYVWNKDKKSYEQPEEKQ